VTIGANAGYPLGPRQVGCRSERQNRYLSDHIDALRMKRSEQRAQAGGLTHLSQTDRTAPDKQVPTGHLIDPGLRVWTTADIPDTRADLRIRRLGSSPSEHATYPQVRVVIHG
jgi:hypothetical protein